MNSYNEIFDRDAMKLGSLDVYVDSAENVQDVFGNHSKPAGD